MLINSFCRVFNEGFEILNLRIEADEEGKQLSLDLILKRCKSNLIVFLPFEKQGCLSAHVWFCVCSCAAARFCFEWWKFVWHIFCKFIVLLFFPSMFWHLTFKKSKVLFFDLSQRNGIPALMKEFGCDKFILGTRRLTTTSPSLKQQQQQRQLASLTQQMLPFLFLLWVLEFLDVIWIWTSKNAFFCHPVTTWITPKSHNIRYRVCGTKTWFTRFIIRWFVTSAIRFYVSVFVSKLA